jgi:hypothetical protein
MIFLQKRLYVLFSSICLCLFLAWAGPFWGQKSVESIDPDAVYHRIRIDSCLAHYPLVDSFDIKSHYPTGNTIHWPNTYTSFLATLQKIFGPKACTWTPVVGGLLCWLLFFFVLFREGKTHWIALPFIAIMLLSHEASNNFRVGTFDHHWAVQLALLLMSFTLLGMSRKYTIAGMAIAFLSSPESIIFVSIYLGLQVLRDILLHDSHHRKSFILFYFSAFFIASGTYILHYLLTVSPPSFFTLDLRIQSLFQPVWFLFLGVFATIGHMFFTSHIEHWKGFRSLLSTFFTTKSNLLIPLGILVMGMWLLFFFFVMDGGLYLNRLSGLDRLRVTEELSPFMYPTLLKTPLHYKLYFLIITGLLGTVLIGKIQKTEALLFLLLLLFGMREFRNLRIISPIVLLLLAYITPPLYEWMWEKKFSPSIKFFIPLSLFLLFLFGLIPAIGVRIRLIDPISRKREVYRELKTCYQKHPEIAASPKLRGILAPWSYGHLLHYYFSLGAIVDPFNFPTPIKTTLKDIYLSDSPTATVAALDKYNADYLLFVWGENNFYSVKPKSISPIRRVSVDGQSITVLNRELCAFPLLLGETDLNIENFELGYVTIHNSQILKPVAIGLGGNKFITGAVPLIQLYKKNTAGRISGLMPASTSCVEVIYEVERSRNDGREKEIQYLSHCIDVQGDGSFCFEVSHWAPGNYSTFRIVSGYTLRIPGFTAYVEIPHSPVPREITPDWIPDNLKRP